MSYFRRILLQLFLHMGVSSGVERVTVAGSGLHPEPLMNMYGPIRMIEPAEGPTSC